MAAAKSKAKGKKAEPVEEVEELEELELDEVEEDEDDEEEEEAPAKSKSKSKAKPKAKAEAKEDDVWGVRQLCELLEEKTGKAYQPREVRTLLRKMAKEDEARVNREVIPGNKARYEWTGPKDPEVKAIIAAVSGGEIEEAKKATLDKLKADKAAKTAKKDKKSKGKAKGKKSKAEAEDEDED